MDTLTLTKPESTFNQGDWELLVETIQQSYRIKRHVDFFRWQQEYVSRILPHDILVAVWGDFSKKHLSYDVCSNIPGFHTGALLEAPGEVGTLMADLYQRWLNNNERWYVINNFNADASDELSPRLFSQKLSQMHSVLVYGVRDIRGSSDSLYVFFDQAPEFPNRRAMLGMLMPHVDSAMRRLECVVPGYEHAAEEEEDFDYPINGLTQREIEIMHWVRMGKTNTEISMILGISPNTVKNHLKRIFSKLDVTSRAQAVATYMQPPLN